MAARSHKHPHACPQKLVEKRFTFSVALARLSFDLSSVRTEHHRGVITTNRTNFPHTTNNTNSRRTRDRPFPIELTTQPVNVCLRLTSLASTEDDHRSLEQRSKTTNHQATQTLSTPGHACERACVFGCIFYHAHFRCRAGWRFR